VRKIVAASGLPMSTAVAAIVGATAARSLGAVVIGVGLVVLILAVLIAFTITSEDRTMRLRSLLRSGRDDPVAPIATPAVTAPAAVPPAALPPAAVPPAAVPPAAVPVAAVPGAERSAALAAGPVAAQPVAAAKPTAERSAALGLVPEQRTEGS